MSNIKLSKVERELLNHAKDVLTLVGIPFTLSNGHPKRLLFGARSIALPTSTKDHRYLLNWLSNIRRAARDIRSSQLHSQ